MPDLTIPVSAALDVKIKTRWGSIAAWRQWVRDITKADIRNATIADAQIRAAALIAQAERDATAEDAAL